MKKWSKWIAAGACLSAAALIGPRSADAFIFGDPEAVEAFAEQPIRAVLEEKCLVKLYIAEKTEMLPSGPFAIPLEDLLKRFGDSIYDEVKQKYKLGPSMLCDQNFPAATLLTSDALSATLRDTLKALDFARRALGIQDSAETAMLNALIRSAIDLTGNGGEAKVIQASAAIAAVNASIIAKLQSGELDPSAKAALQRAVKEIGQSAYNRGKAMAGGALLHAAWNGMSDDERKKMGFFYREMGFPKDLPERLLRVLPTIVSDGLATGKIIKALADLYDDNEDDLKALAANVKARTWDKDSGWKKGVKKRRKAARKFSGPAVGKLSDSQMQSGAIF